MKTTIRLALLLSLFASLAPAAPPEDPARAKIAPWVLKATEGGRSAEYLVVLDEQADLSATESLGTKEEKGRFVHETLLRHAERTQAPLRAALERRGVEHRPFIIVNAILVTGDAPLARELAARRDVRRIDPNPLVRVPLPRPARRGESGPAPLGTLAVEPGVAQVRAPEVWALGITGEGVVVGGADTGIRWTHQALKPRYRGWNGSTASHDYNWHDAIHSGGGACGANSPAPCDDDFHGSHTIGTAVGWDGGANRIGVAPGAKWIGCRNMNQGNGTPATYLECFEFFLAPYPVGGTTAQGDPAKAPDVTTNSWGCPPSEGCNTGNFETMRQAVAAQRAAGILTEASAGNEGYWGCESVADPPAIFDEAFSVGALDTGTSSLASFSSIGPVTVDGSSRVKPDIVAPGTDIRSVYTSSDSSYTPSDGTSMSGPHVGGGAALVIAAFPELRGNVAGIEQRLTSSAARLSSGACGSTAGVYPNNAFGWGRMDLGCAVPGRVTGGAAICQGGSATLTVALVGTPPWTLTWSDGFVQNVTAASPATRVVSPSATTTYTVTNVSKGSCNQPAAGSAIVTVTPDATPPVVTAPAPISVDQSICCGAFGGASGATVPALATFLAAGSATEECSTATRLAPQALGVDATASSCFGAGATAVTFRWRDAASNVGTAVSGVTVRMFGDLNLDGLLDPSDWVILRDYLNFVATPGVAPFAAPLGMADVNHDAAVDPGDFVVVRDYLNLVTACVAP